jgi:uncharacterized protein YbaR (Trm112 family)
VPPVSIALARLLPGEKRWRYSEQVIDDELLIILVCPACREDIELIGDKVVCRNPECRLAYPIEDGVPIMLIERAERYEGPGGAPKDDA